MAQLPQQGRLAWIGIRPARGAAMAEPDEAEVRTASGLTGDRYQRSGGTRQITLIQAEHVAALAGLLNRAAVQPAALRRNLMVAGINLLALKGRAFRIGPVMLEYTGLCHPCSRMEQILGPGGYNALRGHGGITARVLQGGIIRLGDPVSACPIEPVA